MGTSALSSLAAVVNKFTFPDNGAGFDDPAAQAFSYDTDHDAAGERVTADEHKMQGERILILHMCETGENLEQVILLPTRQEAFALDTPLAGFLLLE